MKTEQIINELKSEIMELQRLKFDADKQIEFLLAILSELENK